MWVHHRPSGTRTTQKPPLDDSRAFLPRATLRVMPCAIQALPSSSGEIGWDIIYRLRDAIRPWQNPKFGYSHGPIASLRTPSGGGCAQIRRLASLAVLLRTDNAAVYLRGHPRAPLARLPHPSPFAPSPPVGALATRSVSSLGLVSPLNAHRIVRRPRLAALALGWPPAGARLALVVPPSALADRGITL